MSTGPEAFGIAVTTVLARIWAQMCRLGANVPSGRSASDATIALPVWDKIVHQANALPELEAPAAGQGHGCFAWLVVFFLVAT